MTIDMGCEGSWEMPGSPPAASEQVGAGAPEGVEATGGSGSAMAADAGGNTPRRNSRLGLQQRLSRVRVAKAQKEEKEQNRGASTALDDKLEKELQFLHSVLYNNNGGAGAVEERTDRRRASSTDSFVSDASSSGSSSNVSTAGASVDEDWRMSNNAYTTHDSGAQLPLPPPPPPPPQLPSAAGRAVPSASAVPRSAVACTTSLGRLLAGSVCRDYGGPDGRPRVEEPFHVMLGRSCPPPMSTMWPVHDTGASGASRGPGGRRKDPKSQRFDGMRDAISARCNGGGPRGIMTSVRAVRAAVRLTRAKAEEEASEVKQSSVDAAAAAHANGASLVPTARGEVPSVEEKKDAGAASRGPASSADTSPPILC